MNMKLKTAFAATTVLAAAFLIGSTVIAADDTYERGFSHHGDFHGGPHGRHSPGKMLKKLDLTPEQQDAVHDVMEGSRPAMHEAYKAKRDNQRRLMDITPDDAAYSATVDEVAQANAELAARTTRLGAQTQASIWALLTDEQKARAVELRAEMEQRMLKHRAERKARRAADVE